MSLCLRSILLLAGLVAHIEARRLADTTSTSTSLPWNQFLKAYTSALGQEVCIPQTPNLDEAATYCAKESMAKLPAAIATFNSALDTVPKICAHSRSDLLSGRRMTVLAAIELVMAACKPLQEGWWQEGKAWAPLFRDGPEPFVARFSAEAYSMLCSDANVPPDDVDEAAKMCAMEAATKLEKALEDWKPHVNTPAKICKIANNDPKIFESDAVLNLCSKADDQNWMAGILDRESFRSSFAKVMKHLSCSGMTSQGVQLPEQPKEAAAVCIEKASAEFPKLLQQFYYNNDLQHMCSEKASAFADEHFIEPCKKVFDHDWASHFLTYQTGFKEAFAQLLYEQTCLPTKQTDQDEEQEEDPQSVETVAKACAAISAKELPSIMADFSPELSTTEKLCAEASKENGQGKGYEILKSRTAIETCKLLRQEKWKAPVINRVDEFTELYSQELFSQMCAQPADVTEGKRNTLASMPTTVEQAAELCAKKSAMLVKQKIPHFKEPYNSLENACRIPEFLIKAVTEDSTGSMWCDEIRDLWHYGTGPWVDLFAV